jgi:hypothetical protein
MREWRANHPEHREYMRQWREANKERISKWRRERYLAHLEEENAYAVAWDKEHVLESVIIRKVCSANNRYHGKLCTQDIRDLIERDGWFCHWCKKPIETLKDFTLEHLEPVNDPAVLALACHSCNCARLPRWGLMARLQKKEYLDRRKDAKREYDKRWKEEHRDQENEGQRKRYWAHVEERRAYFREWQRKKRERDRSQDPRDVPAK